MTELGFGVNLELLTNYGEESPSGDQTFWIRKELQDKVIVAGRVPGNLDPEDLSMKSLAEASIVEALGRHGLAHCGFARRHGG